MTLSFRVAQNPGDYARVHSLLKKEGISMGGHSLTMPTIIATLGGEVVGALGTTIQDHMIVAGPLALESSQRRIFTALRLVEAYENAMKNLGVVTYIMGIESGSILEKVAKRYYSHIPPYAGAGNMMFYIRRLDGSQEAANGSA